MPLQRRSFLASGSAVLASLSGCLGVNALDSSRIGLVVYNYTAERQPLKVEILREDPDEYDDALVFEREFEIDASPDGESASVVRESDVAQRRRYLVRVLPKNGTGRWHHYHFYPGESSSDPDSERVEVRIHRGEESDSLGVRFR